MEAIDQIYIQHPFKGSRRIRDDLRKAPCFLKVNRKKIQRLMRLMDLQAIYPKPRASQKDQKNQIYPNLVERLTINHPDQAWTADITYIKLKTNWAYLIAIMDWFSRYVVEWQLSPSLKTDFCLKALEASLRSGKPLMFHSDQGVQFTSKEFTSRLKESQIKISMTSKARYQDNILIERLWRTVKYEDIYLKHYSDILEAEQGLKQYFWFYNWERKHSSLENKTPGEVYWKNKGRLVNLHLNQEKVSLKQDLGVQRIGST